MFSLGCIIAEIYTLAPLFSKRSIVKYINGFGDSDRPDSSNASSYWSADVTSKMLGMPVNMKVKDCMLYAIIFMLNTDTLFCRMQCWRSSIQTLVRGF